MFKSIKKFTFSSLLLVTFLACTGLFLFGIYFYAELSEKQSKQLSESISKQVYASMYMVMKKGWGREELQEFVYEVKHSFKDSSFDVSIYRGNLVDTLFGYVPQHQMDERIKETFSKPKKQFLIEENSYRTIYPIVAQNACLQCHTNAKVGSVLGVIEVKHDYASDLVEAKNTIIMYFILSALLVMLLAIFVSSRVSKRIHGSIDNLDKKIDEIQSVNDLAKFEVQDSDMGFEEINNIMENINTLTHKFRDISVDKDLLEFEVKLLNRFVITPEVSQEWQTFVKELLTETNAVVNTYCMYTLFQSEHGQIEADIFWKAKVSLEIQEYFREVLEENIAAYDHFNQAQNLFIKHHIVNEEESLDDVSIEQIQTQVKSLLFDNTKVGGIVGVGVESSAMEDSVRFIILDSVLSTLLNLLGSLKSLYKFNNEIAFYATKDPLTQQLNEKVLHEILFHENQMVRITHEGYALLMLKVNNYQATQKYAGCVLANTLIQRIAQVINKSLRPEDIIARFNEDSFVAVLPRSNETHVQAHADALIKVLQEVRVTTDEQEHINAQVCMSAVVYDGDETTPAELLAMTQMLLEDVKENVSVNIMHQTKKEELLEVIAHKQALVEETIEQGLINAYFQPILEVESSEVRMHEVVMPLLTSELSQEEFIALAQSMGVYQDLELLFLEKSLEEMQNSLYNGKVIMKLSAKNLVMASFLERLESLANEYQIKRSNLVFELDETECMKSFYLLEQFITKLKDAGFSICIGGFKNGFASFTYLKKMPLDFIRFDGNFVRMLHKSKDEKAYMKSMQTLLKELRVISIAEQVEDFEVYKEVSSLGIEYIQGLFVAAPQELFTSTQDLDF